EPNAALTRIVDGEHAMDVQEGDHVIFSCSVIPTPINEAHRYKVEKNIREQGGLLYRDIHTSGHAKREGNREMLRTLEPENIIPAHGTTEMLASYATLAREEGYRLGENVFLSENGGTVEIE
ncbi:MAG: ribonuclease J, partial [Candidatus Nanohaloarchaeota archaeon QJJ-5]|nr:ribonuclease J [Candidatus Nanohaloarchaeota archaeon QJJ-5]